MSNCSDRRQRGTALIEALLGAAIMTIIGAGTAQIADRIMVGQRELRAEGIAVAQLRQMLATEGSALCGATNRKLKLPSGDLVTVEEIVCDTDAPKITVAPVSTAVGAPAGLEVDAVKPVMMRVRLSNLAVQADAPDAEIVVGTRS